MSYAHNKRRGGKANRPRPVRLCHTYKQAWRIFSHTDRGIEGLTMLERCNAAVSPSTNGNRCEDHRRST